MIPFCSDFFFFSVCQSPNQLISTMSLILWYSPTYIIKFVANQFGITLFCRSFGHSIFQGNVVAVINFNIIISIFFDRIFLWQTNTAIFQRSEDGSSNIHIITLRKKKGNKKVTFRWMQKWQNKIICIVFYCSKKLYTVLNNYSNNWISKWNQSITIEVRWYCVSQL